MTSKIRHLAARSQRVYEYTLLEHFSEEFRKQQQVQAIKFAIILIGIAGLIGLTLFIPISVMGYIKQFLL